MIKKLMNTKFIFFMGILVTLYIMLLTATAKCDTPKHKKIATIQQVYDYIIELDIEYPIFVLAQSCLESNYFTSRLARTHKNIFGMKVAKQRATTSLNKTGFARYKSYKESILDYKLWQMQNPPQQNETFFAYITRRNYFDKKFINIYYKNLISIKKKLEDRTWYVF